MTLRGVYVDSGPQRVSTGHCTSFPSPHYSVVPRLCPLYTLTFLSHPLSKQERGWGHLRGLYVIYRRSSTGWSVSSVDTETLRHQLDHYLRNNKKREGEEIEWDEKREWDLKNPIAGRLSPNYIFKNGVRNGPHSHEIRETELERERERDKERDTETDTVFVYGWRKVFVYVFVWRHGMTGGGERWGVKRSRNGKPSIVLGKTCG